MRPTSMGSPACVQTHALKLCVSSSLVTTLRSVETAAKHRAELRCSDCGGRLSFRPAEAAAHRRPDKHRECSHHRGAPSTKVDAQAVEPRRTALFASRSITLPLDTEERVSRLPAWDPRRELCTDAGCVGGRGAKHNTLSTAMSKLLLTAAALLAASTVATADSNVHVLVGAFR